MTVNQFVVRRGVHVLFMLGLFWAFDVPSSGALQAGQTFTISVNHPRPLASAIEVLENRHGWVITYEDPPLLHPSDIEDVTLAVRRDHDLKKPRVLAPRGGPFNFRYSIPAGRVAPDESALLERLLEEYHRSGHPGVFRVRRTGAVFHVVPTESKNALGHFEPRVSLLDSTISISDRERSALGMIEEITAVVSGPAARVGIGTVPFNLLNQVSVRGGARNESARSVLLRTLETTNRKMSWALLCDPGPAPICALNLHFVNDRTDR